MTVVYAANGYPDRAADRLGDPRHRRKRKASTAWRFSIAGTRRDGDGTLRAAGGRVLNVTAIGDTLAQAVARAYAAVDRIDWPGGFCRRDIAWRALG